MHRYTIAHAATGLVDGPVMDADTREAAYRAYVVAGGTRSIDELHVDRMGLVGCGGTCEYEPSDVSADWRWDGD